MNNSTNATSGPPLSTPNEAERIFKIVFYVILFIVGIIGNFLVVIVVKAKHKHRTVNDYFILNLAISDLTFLCFALPFYYYELFERFTKFEFYCKFVWPMMSITLLVSVFTLTLMAVERCRAIMFPFRPRIKKPTLFIGIILVWILSVLCMVPLMAVARPEGTFCMEKWPNDHLRKAYTAVLFVLQFAMPITVIAVAYITIVITLYKTKVPNRTSVNERGQVVKQKSRADNLHIIRTVAIIVVLFVICMLPNQMAWILYDFGGKQYENLSEKFWLLAEALVFFHSCVNPIIYGSLTRQFRDGYIQYLRYFCCCGRGYTPKGIDLTDHHQNITKARIAGRLAYQGSLKSPSTVNEVRTSCQGPTVNTSCRFGISSSARSHPSPARSHPSSIRKPSELKRSPSSPTRPSTNRARPPSPLIIDNKMVAIQEKISSAGLKNISNNTSMHIEETSCPIVHNDKQESDIDYKMSKGNKNNSVNRKKQILSNEKTSSATALEGNNDILESTILQNPAALEIDQENKRAENYGQPLGSSSEDSISQSELTSRKDNIEHSQSKSSNLSGGCSSGSSDNYGIEDDEPSSVQDTHL